MVARGDMQRRRGRGDEVDPASDGTADPERRERQSALRRQLREEFPDRARDNLLPILHALQHEHGYLPEWALQVVGWHIRVPASEVYGAATSYSELRLEPPSPCSVVVCTGLACWQAGGDEIFKVAIGGFTDGHEVTVTSTACAFVCGLAPAVSINGRWHGRMAADRVIAAIEVALQ